MVLPVHLRLSAVVAIMDCPGRSQFIGSPSLKQAALQSIWLFQESLNGHKLSGPGGGSFAGGWDTYWIGI